MDYRVDIEKKLVQLAQLVLEDRRDEALLLLRRDLPRLARLRPDLSDKIASTMSRATAQVARRNSVDARPVDVDTKLQLVKEELLPTPEIDPVWPDEIEGSLRNLVVERKKIDRLLDAGISPTRTSLFIGAPGVGKTLAARWIAQQTSRPLLTLDLAAVMSSFLGRTGNNIRAVLDYAKSNDSVLLLDEFDAIAKRRDDSTDVGELKRLVTVLLQSVDEWPPTGLLIAATNHPELLDPAVWRRFDSIVEFPLPGIQEVAELVGQLLESDTEVSKSIVSTVASILEGKTPAEIVREINSAKRESVLFDIPLEKSLLSNASSSLKKIPTEKKLVIAERLQKFGLNQREIHNLTGLSRDTLRAKGIAVRKKRRASTPEAGVS